MGKGFKVDNITVLSYPKSECKITFRHSKVRNTSTMAKTENLRADRLFDVKGHVCVVTGGGTGIGLMATQALAANGAKVYITGRRKEVLENAAKTHTPKSSDKTLNGEIIPVGPCDVTSKA